MFVVRELDKLLQDIGTLTKPNNRNANLTIPDIRPINIERLRLHEKLNLPYGRPLTFDQVTQNEPDNKVLSFTGQSSYPTTDTLFLKLMSQFVLSKLIKLPERQYPWAKLLICDRFSYDLLLKHERILSLAPDNMKNFLHRPPFVITAIFELDNIVTLLERSGEPLTLDRRDPHTGKPVSIYNYALIKKVFPYLRMSDLVFIIEDKYLLEVRLLQILNFLAHFARSFQLIELGGINKIIGCPHPTQNNILVIRPKLPAWRDYYTQLPLTYLSFLATQLVSLADKLKLRLETVTYRAADPHQQTKMFARFLTTAIDKKEHDLLNFRIARVLVMDRFHDLGGTLRHADRYEAFLGQEKSQISLLAASGQHLTDRAKLGTIDEHLSSKLYQVRLTEVLGVILGHALHYKPSQPERPPGARRAGRLNRFVVPKPSRHSLSAAISAGQSIRRNLDIVKILYKSLNEGYLILLKLESSLDSIVAELRQSEKPLDERRQIVLAERLQRLVSACRQLLKVTTKTIDSKDVTRLSCLIADAINLFQVHNLSGRAMDLIARAKVSLLREKDFVPEHKSRFDSTGEQTSNLFKKYQAFDLLSKATCNHKSKLTIDETLERMLDDRLDDKSYPTNKLVEELKYSKDIKITVVLVFLGALTADELTRIKLIESQLKKQYQLCDLLVLFCSIVAPDEFLDSL